MNSFRTTDNAIFSNYYNQYHCDALDRLKVEFVPENGNHIDPFSILGNCIFCDPTLIEIFQLSEMECYSCIAHEVGHFLDSTERTPENQIQRELNADSYVKNLGLAEYLISALTKICPENELTEMRIQQLNQ